MAEETTPLAGSHLSGILVSKDAAYTLLSPADLREYTGLSTSTILQKQKLVINVGWETVRWHLNGMYGGIIEGLDAEGVLTFRVRASLFVIVESLCLAINNFLDHPNVARR